MVIHEQDELLTRPGKSPMTVVLTFNVFSRYAIV